MEAGQGTPLVHLHGAGGLRLTRAHDLLSKRYQVIVFEMPGFGAVGREHAHADAGANSPPRWDRR